MMKCLGMRSNFGEIRIPFIVLTAFLFLLVPAILMAAESKKGEFKIEIPLGLEESAYGVPADNPMTREKVELGRFLFFDRRLSKDNTISCSSCHMSEFAFTDGKPVSTGIKGQKGGRSAPTVINRAFSTVQFWDGRAATLEEQAVGPLVNPIEHGFPNHEELVQKLNGIKGYKKEFRKVFGTDVTKEGIGKAIAAFERTIISGNSRFDQYDLGGKEDALSESEKKGLTLFRGKARCTKCHSGFNFTDEKGAFKAPTLREITKTAPYMHDGRFKTLEEVVEFYNKGGIKNPSQDPLIIPLELTEEEKKDVVAFLHSLNGEGWQQVKAPAKFPQ